MWSLSNKAAHDCLFFLKSIVPDAICSVEAVENDSYKSSGIHSYDMIQIGEMSHCRTTSFAGDIWLMPNCAQLEAVSSLSSRKASRRSAIVEKISETDDKHS
ncbi:hypothetical protein WUBG_00595 [Wuchereria bancrofti]|uniref:Uncharacterized protein n=1 Tax=Wuchereria bancrofti TaxID=6293 RepID=J9FFS2_WUCBA|nr:hypothetical protein WUBG_00595 [Wuchereria bancrofti]VDM07061.1 unnamed protein product [Wuchereria bancrofti]